MAQVRDFKECVSKALPDLVEDLEKLKHEVKDLWSVAEDLRYKPATPGLVHKVNKQISGLTKAIAITKVSSVINKHLKACFRRGISNTAKRFVSMHIENWLDNKVSTEEFALLITKNVALKMGIKFHVSRILNIHSDMYSQAWEMLK
jgi:hypothetical protein